MATENTVEKINLQNNVTLTLVDATALHVADFAGIEDLPTRNTVASLTAKLQEVLDALKGKTAAVALAAFALAVGSSAFGAAEVQTARFDEIWNDEPVVTNVTGLAELATTNRVEEIASWFNHGPVWSTPFSWGIEFTLSSSSSSRKVLNVYTNECGQVFEQEETQYVRNLEAFCRGALYDEYATEALVVSGWQCLTPGGTITDDGHLTAQASGIYRVSCNSQFGDVKYAEVPISNGAQEIKDVAVYILDLDGTARKSINDEALAWINAAPNRGPGSADSTASQWYKWEYFTQPAWAATSAGRVGNVAPFAVGTKFLVGATHYPGWCKWTGAQTIGGVTVTKGGWVPLAAWALTNGWTSAQVEQMDIVDISVIPLTAGEVPLSECPWLMSEAKMKEIFGRLQGVQCWCATQAFTEPMQLVYTDARGDGSSWSFVMGSEKNRSDIAAKLKTMGAAYPIHSGDSGHPVYFRYDGKWFVTSHFTLLGCGPCFIRALPVLKAYAASVGSQLNVME